MAKQDDDLLAVLENCGPVIEFAERTIGRPLVEDELAVVRVAYRNGVLAGFDACATCVKNSPAWRTKTT